MSSARYWRCRMRTLVHPDASCEDIHGVPEKVLKEVDDNDLLDVEEEPDGKRDVGAGSQPLPDYLSYSEYGTMVNGQWVQTGTIVEVAQTYYGQWIPLGPGWTYGGMYSPTGNAGASPGPSPTVNYAPQYAAQPQSEDPSEADASDASPSAADDGSPESWQQSTPPSAVPELDDSSPSAAASPMPAASPNPATLAHALVNPSPSPLTAPLPTLIVSPQMTVTVTDTEITELLASTGMSTTLTGSSSSSSSKHTTSRLDTITYSPLPAKYLTSLPNSAYISSMPTFASNSSSTSACASCSPAKLAANSDFAPLVPAIVVPLLAIIAIIAGVLYYLWRKSRRNQLITRTRPVGFGSWLIGLVNPKAKKRQRDRYTRIAPSTPLSSRRSILKTSEYDASSPGAKTPDEKSDLLSNHHRSLSVHSNYTTPQGQVDQGLIGRISGGIAAITPSRWAGGKDSPSPRRTSGHSVERGYSEDGHGPYGHLSPDNPYRSAVSANGFGGASTSPHGLQYVSLDSQDRDGPLILYNPSPASTLPPPEGSLQRSKSEYTPSRPSGLRHVQTAMYGSPPPFHLSRSSGYMNSGDRKTLAQTIYGDGQDMGEMNMAIYAERAHDIRRGLMSPDSVFDTGSPVLRNAISPVNFPIAQPISDSGHILPPLPRKQIKYGPDGRIILPPEYSAYAEYPDLLSQYARSTPGVGRNESGVISPGVNDLSPESAYPSTVDNHHNVPNIMDILANYGYDPKAVNPIAYTVTGPSKSPPALMEPMPMHHERQRRGSHLEGGLMPSGQKSPHGARGPSRTPGSPRSPRRKGYAVFDEPGSPSPKPRGKSRTGMSEVSHYSDERETVISGNGRLADLIRKRSAEPVASPAPGRPVSTAAATVYTAPSESRSKSSGPSAHGHAGQERQSPGPAIRHQTPLKVPGGWSDMPPPPRLQGFDTLSQAHEADFGTRPEGGVEEHAGSQAGPGGSGWFKWITDAGGNTMSRGA